MELLQNTKTIPFGHHGCLQELINIANWWSRHSVDTTHGGFLGEIDFYGKQVNNAAKGIVLNSRILWFFSVLPQFNTNAHYIEMADRAFNYIVKYFDDKHHGGVYWELDYNGQLIDGKKQTYAQCFSIYALVAYFRLTENRTALNKALAYFDLIETHARDKVFGGYIECFSQQWQAVTDFRLSEKDMNLPKTMNTHLHVLEAYSALHSVAPSIETEAALRHVIALFDKHIIDKHTHHLKLFFDMQWNDYSQTYSFGHDIEASWLIWEALEVLGDNTLLSSLKPTVCNMAHTCLTEAVGNKGQVCDEFHIASKTRSEDSFWWVQAEALVGFMNAYYLTMDPIYQRACVDIWRYICDYHLDESAGEWHWQSTADNTAGNPMYKAGFWKAPYHNGRAMMEVCKLFDRFKD